MCIRDRRELDRGMRIAQQIQHSLLPRELPVFSSVDLAAFNHPAMDIGGDYYDFIRIDDQHIGLAIADVSGKGIGGALMMAVCRSVLRVNAERVYDPANMLGTLNRILSENLAEDMFISMLYMVLNLETHQLSYARAGHEAPIIIRNGEPKADHAETAGVAIGFVDNETFSSIIQTRNVSLRPGDLVVTYTDSFLTIRSLLAVPMRFGNEVLGVLVLTNRTDETAFTPGDLTLLQAMADQASVHIHYDGLRAAL